MATDIYIEIGLRIILMFQGLKKNEVNVDLKQRIYYLFIMSE